MDISDGVEFIAVLRREHSIVKTSLRGTCCTKWRV
jgi:hypothetical protein